MNLGKFEILEEVGHGGFGTVYRANDTTLDRIVALKVLHDQYNSDQKFIESFKREAKLMAKISHPNVVQILEVGDFNGQIYIAMTFFDAGNLEDKINRDGPLPLKDAVRMLNQVARGLEAGHKIGLVHRDIKPANILYNRDGYIAISDFGVAKSIQQGSIETTNSFNQFAGSPYYIPPELWQSKGNTSPAADVYSLACVFYEALTGEILFAGDTYEHVLTRHVLEAPVFSSSLPENLADLLSVALAKNPSDRYQTMNDFLLATRTALESKLSKTEISEPSTKTEVIDELPKPLIPGEITFDQLVRQARSHTQAQSQAVKPAQPAPPAKPVIETILPVVEKPKPVVKVTLPAKETAKPVVESPKPREKSPSPQPQSEKPETKPSNVNFKPFSEFHPADSDPENLPPVATNPASEEKVRIPPIRQMVEEKPATARRPTGSEAPNKKKVPVPLLIGLGLVTLLAVFLVVWYVVLPSRPETFTALETTQPPTPTTKLVPSNYRKRDGMEMVYVPEGTFVMGSDKGDDDEKPVRQVYLDDYWIDKYEVSNAQYAHCVSEGACTEPSSASSYTRENYFGYAAHVNYPAVHITWKQAQKYCQWTGGDLPTEAQWEKAARGQDGREYPWGSEPPDKTRANYDLNIGDTTEVGSYPSGASPYGVLDLAGNVSEWVRDGYSDYGVYNTYNPIGSLDNPYRTIRGGNYFELPASIRSTYRFYGEPTLSGYDIGFRCILPPSTSELSSTKIDLAILAPTPSPTSEFSIGSTKFRELDEMEMVFVPEGSFEMGSNTGDEDEKPVRQVFLDAYWIDKFEITNEQYERCRKNGACTYPRYGTAFTRDPYYHDPNFANYPVIFVDWSQAQEYCRWAGGNLPTEAQWEKAARGEDGRTYPWGDKEPDNNLAIYCGLKQGCDTVEVGSYLEGASSYGALDMAGNVEEWTLDSYGGYDSKEINNPTGLKSGQLRVVRGGAWSGYSSNELRTSNRSQSSMTYISDSLGFRCALPSVTSSSSSTKVTQTSQVGSTIGREQDGMEQVLVPAGRFMMGSEDGEENEKPVHEVYLDAFYIDKYEVTNAQYEKCVKDGRCRAHGTTSSTTHDNYYGNPEYANYPVIWVSKKDAEVYCQSVGGALPTEAQWEKAARGTDGRMYPWGEQLDGNKANLCDSNCELEWKGKVTEVNDGYLDTAPVGSYPEGASSYGAMDMAGNVAEWVSDRYSETYYAASPSENPTGPTSGYPMLRGGSLFGDWQLLRAAFRTGPFPDEFAKEPDIGFRCVSPAP